MSAIATAGAVLASIKTALDIAKAAKDAGSALDQAELKLRLSEIISALADAKIEMADVSEELQLRDTRIVELEDAFQSKDSVVRVQDAYYIVDKAGNASGEPLCAACWETRHKKFGLARKAAQRMTRSCLSCGRDYEVHGTPTLRPSESGVPN